MALDPSILIGVKPPAFDWNFCFAVAAQGRAAVAEPPVIHGTAAVGIGPEPPVINGASEGSIVALQPDLPAVQPPEDKWTARCRHLLMYARQCKDTHRVRRLVQEACQNIRPVAQAWSDAFGLRHGDQLRDLAAESAGSDVRLHKNQWDLGQTIRFGFRSYGCKSTSSTGLGTHLTLWKR